MKKTFLILSLMAIIFAGCKKEEDTEPQTCTCPATSVDLDSRVIGTWEKVVKEDDVSKHYLVLKDGSYSHNLIEELDGQRLVGNNDEILLIQLGLYKVDGNNLSITRSNNGVEIEVKYTKTSDISVADWVKNIELDINNKFSLYDSGFALGDLTQTTSKLWARSYEKLYELDPNDYSVLNIIQNYDYGWQGHGSMTYIDNKLLILNGNNDLIFVDENNGDILDTIEINVINDNIRAICANDNKIWYYDDNESDKTGKLIQIDLSGNVLKTIDIKYNDISDIVFINNEMYLVTSQEGILNKFDISSEKFTKSYNFYYNTENNYISADNGVSVVNDKFIIEYYRNANSVSTSVFQ